MSESKQRQFHTPELKAKVGLEAIRGTKTINEIALEFGVHPVQVGQWKKQIQEQAKTLFEGKRGQKPAAPCRETSTQQSGSSSAPAPSLSFCFPLHPNI